MVPLTALYPSSTAPRLIPTALPLTPYPDQSNFPLHSESDVRPADRGSPACSPEPPSLGSLTIRPDILGSQQSTLRARTDAQLSPWRARGGGASWHETDSLTARQPAMPHWISSLGEVRRVDEVDMEICVLCGRERFRRDVTVREFELGGGSRIGVDATNGNGQSRETDGWIEGSVLCGSGEDGPDHANLAVGRWMVCRDTVDCDRAVEQAAFADDEE
jgi:hypothetical protein